jgi:hypothetical protein
LPVPRLFKSADFLKGGGAVCNLLHLIIKQNIGLTIIVITDDFVSCFPFGMENMARLSCCSFRQFFCGCPIRNYGGNNKLSICRFARLVFPFTRKNA